MGLFAPWFLLGLAGLAAPLYLHLLRKQTTIPRPFSSLMFMEPRTQSSIRHRRLRYLWLLALRLALLGLLALAFANPFIVRPTASVAADATTLLVVDHSFSMRAGNRLAEAKRDALAALNAAHGRAQVAALGARLEVLTQLTSDRAALRAAIVGIEPGDERADYGQLARSLRALESAGGAGRGAPARVEVFSDFLHTSLPPNFSDLAMPANVSLALHPVANAAAPNWTVETIQAPARVYGSPRQTQPARVEAVIAGFDTPARTLQVSLVVNGRTQSSQSIAVPPSGRATVVFPSLVVPYGWSRCQVRIDGANDPLAADDAADFAVERTDPERVLFIHNAGDALSPLYFSAALGSGSNAAFLLDSGSAGAAASMDPSRYAFVVVSDVPALPAAFTLRLRSYVRSGGGLLIAAGTAAQSLPVWGGGIQGSNNYSLQAQTVGSSDPSQPSTAALGNWAGVRFFFAIRASASGARVLARLSDQTPLLMQKTLGEGRIELFASGLDKLTNDFPLNADFVPFVRETARYLAGEASSGGAQPVDAYLTLRTAKEQGVGAEVTDPQGRQLLSLDQSATASVIQLTQAGFYQVRLANGREAVVGVNPDRRESDLTPITADTLSLWHGGGSAAPGAGQPGAPSTVPVSIWWYVMLLLLAAAIAESVFAARYLGVRREQDEAVELQEVV